MGKKTPREWFIQHNGFPPEQATPEGRRDEYHKLLDVAKDKGFKQGFAFFRFKDLFPEEATTDPLDQWLEEWERLEV